MKSPILVLTGLFLLSALSSLAAPHLEFEYLTTNYGRIVANGEINGVFKYKNTGDAPVTITNIAPSCDCTLAKADPLVVAPGQSGQLTYTITVDHPLVADRSITIHTDDSANHMIRLIASFDYVPLYETAPLSLPVTMGATDEQVVRSFTINRMDGKPLGIDRLMTSAPWITAQFDSTYQPPAASGFDVTLEPQKSAAKIDVTIHRPPGPPGLINGSVEMWSSNQVDHPLRVVKISGEMEAELAANPTHFYWVLADYGREATNYPDENISRHIEVKSLLGKPVTITKATTDVKDLHVQVTPKDDNKTFDVKIKFSKLPPKLVNGKIYLETSLASVPKLEIDFTVAPPYEL